MNDTLPILSTMISWENDLLSRIQIGQPTSALAIRMPADGVEVGSKQFDQSWTITSAKPLKPLSAIEQNAMVNERLRQLRRDLVDLIHKGGGLFCGLQQWVEWPDLGENIMLMKKGPLKRGLFEMFLHDLWLRGGADFDRGEWVIIVNPVQAEGMRNLDPHFTCWENGQWSYHLKHGWNFPILAERKALSDQLIIANLKALSWFPRNGDVELTIKQKAHITKHNFFLEPVGLVVSNPRQNFGALVGLKVPEVEE